MPYGTVNADLMTTSDGVSSAGLYGFKNRLINGSFSIAQRATSATITAGSTIAAGYSTVDRFYVYCTGANVTAAQVAGSGSTKNRLQITGASSVTAVGIGQRIEQANSYDLANTTATLSCDIANSLLTTVTWTAFYANTADTFGTLASPTRTQIATGNFTVTSTVTRYNAQISIPAAATTGIEIVFTVGAQTSGTWTIGNIQLEKGSTATSFDYRPIGTELNLCQRYYNKWSGANSPFIGLATALLTGGTAPAARRVSWSNPVDFRSQPTMGSGGTIQFYTSGLTNLQFSAFAGTQSNKNIISFDINSTSAGTAGQSAMFVIDSSLAANFIDASAEL
jgi:hypothetical protein